MRPRLRGDGGRGRESDRRQERCALRHPPRHERYADEDGHEVLVVKKFSITEYVATATKIVAAMVESL